MNRRSSTRLATKASEENTTLKTSPKKGKGKAGRASVRSTSTSSAASASSLTPPILDKRAKKYLKKRKKEVEEEAPTASTTLTKTPKERKPAKTLPKGYVIIQEPIYTSAPVETHVTPSDVAVNSSANEVANESAGPSSSAASSFTPTASSKKLKGDPKLGLDKVVDPYFKTPTLPSKRVSRPSARLMASWGLQEAEEVRTKAKTPKGTLKGSKTSPGSKGVAALHQNSAALGSSNSEMTPLTFNDDDNVEMMEVSVDPVEMTTAAFSPIDNDKHSSPLPPQHFSSSERLQMINESNDDLHKKTLGYRGLGAKNRGLRMRGLYVPRGNGRLGQMRRQSTQPPFNLTIPKPIKPSSQLQSQSPSLSQLPLQPQRILANKQPPMVRRGHHQGPGRMRGKLMSNRVALQGHRPLNPPPQQRDPRSYRETKNTSIYDVMVKKSTMAIKNNFIAWVNGELKLYFPPLSLAPLYELPTNVPLWTTAHVHTFISLIGFPQTAEKMLKGGVDGVSLLLLKFQDLGPVFRLKPNSASQLFSFLMRLHQNLYTILMPNMMGSNNPKCTVKHPWEDKAYQGIKVRTVETTIENALPPRKKC